MCVGGGRGCVLAVWGVSACVMLGVCVCDVGSVLV